MRFIFALFALILCGGFVFADNMEDIEKKYQLQQSQAIRKKQRAAKNLNPSHNTWQYNQRSQSPNHKATSPN
ncbi:Uncharacterised protein [Helicobacter fennelliae]|uniref:Periplasmic protein n=1 Tax=Helicobacter fennelliae TaxID=215 RepID=A0A2X3GMA5_9HELI|nr:hypothetical protein [Helicobacter fennelliae]SQC36250.1 Uncharacterised protein [Helicobacter fennelliae]